MPCLCVGRDAPGLVSDTLLRDYLQLDQVMDEADGNTMVVKASALTGDHLDTVVKWLALRLHAREATPSHPPSPTKGVVAPTL